MPARLLTPALVFAGVNSSLGLDAGYVVLPPVAAALFHAVGRPPLAGLAAAFAGVAGGFSANLFDHQPRPDARRVQHRERAPGGPAATSVACDRELVAS